MLTWLSDFDDFATVGLESSHLRMLVVRSRRTVFQALRYVRPTAHTKMSHAASCSEDTLK